MKRLINSGMFLTLLWGTAFSFADSASRPNMIVIVTDDQGYGDMACHGNPWLRTPNLDRLHAQSVRLEDYPHYAVLTETWRLVDGQLFQIVEDPGQRVDLAAKHPDVVAQLTEQYGRHFDDVFSGDASFTRFQIGMPEENPTRFTVRDWHPTRGRVIWKQEQLGDESIQINGFWAVNVVRAGTYRVRLSRFPDESQAPMGASVASLKIGDQELSKSIRPSDEFAVFDVELKQGHGLLQSWLRNAETNVERGAYYVQVERLGE